MQGFCMVKLLILMNKLFLSSSKKSAVLEDQSLCLVRKIKN